MSLHRYDNQTFYPKRSDATPDNVGAEEGKGFNVNVAWNTGEIADEEVRENNTETNLGCAEYRYACDTLLFPIVKQFKPDLILISCGFDSGIHDKLGWSCLSPIMYFYMTR